jgi:hypothetical protein
MNANGSTPSMRHRPWSATALAWISGTIATVLTLFYVYMIVAAISEWSRFFAHGAGEATTVLAIFGLVTLCAWGAFALAISAARSDR